MSREDASGDTVHQLTPKESPIDTEHISGTSLTDAGLVATCECGWRSAQAWDRSDDGMEQAHAAGHDHIAEATGSPPPGRAQQRHSA